MVPLRAAAVLLQTMGETSVPQHKWVTCLHSLTRASTLACRPTYFRPRRTTLQPWTLTQPPRTLLSNCSISFLLPSTLNAKFPNPRPLWGNQTISLHPFFIPAKMATSHCRTDLKQMGQAADHKGGQPMKSRRLLTRLAWKKRESPAPNSALHSSQTLITSKTYSDSASLPIPTQKPHSVSSMGFTTREGYLGWQSLKRGSWVIGALQ